MATQVLQVIPDEGQLRVTLAEPHGQQQAHRTVVARTPGLTFDRAGTATTTLDDGRVASVPYQTGDPCPQVEVHLAGQTRFHVPAAATQLVFDDGTVVDIPDQPAAS